jgi:hypothetical protein
MLADWRLLARLAGDVGLAHGAIVAEHEEGEELNLEIAAGRLHSVLKGGSRMRVERDKVGLLGRFD